MPTLTSGKDADAWLAAEVEPHRATLRAWLKLRFPWLHDVDNIAQESIIRVWRRKLRADKLALASPKAALFVIARNLAIDESRRNSIVSFDVLANTPNSSLADSDDVVAAVNSRQELEVFVRALEHLPRRCRQILTLTKLHGKTEREVSEVLGISENTVRTQVVRGMSKCVEFLNQHGVFRGKNRRGGTP